MKKGQFAIIVALIVIIGGVLIGITYKKLDNGGEKEKTEEKANKSSNVNNSISVVDAFDGHLIYDADFTNWNARIPKILGNTNAINALNKKILNQSIYDITRSSVCHAQNKECFSNGLTIKYKNKVNNKILIIETYSEGGNDWGGNSYPILDYFYDIENDKELDIIETSKALKTGILDEDTKEKLDYDKIDLNNGYAYLDYDKMEFLCVSCVR